MLTVITGPMFAGKTTELIRRIRCARIARQQTLVLKPAVDTRSGLEIVSHNGVSLAARSVAIDAPEDLPEEIDVLGIDEAQFLQPGWLPAIERLADSGKEVVCSCLNQDFRGRPFGITPSLLAMADQVVHLKAVCTKCGRKDRATKTNRTSGGDAQVEIGGADRYRALCRACWVEARVDQQSPALTACVA